MQYSNADILAAVLAKWSQPIISAMAQDKAMRLPFLSNIEAKMKASGWVSNRWSISSEISPFVEQFTQAMAAPLIKKAIADLPDDAIPAFAFGIVDKAISVGTMEILDGRIKFSKEDLEQLRRLLELNMALPAASYNVKEE